MPREPNVLRRLPTCDPQPPFDDEFAIGPHESPVASEGNAR